MAYHLLEAFGIELEYMIVDKASLAVQPITDTLIKNVTGEYSNEVNKDRVDWSNELVLHVVELKNNTPEPDLVDLVDCFQGEVEEVNSQLNYLGCQMMPGAMHPLMEPLKETKIWPHGNNEIYDSFNRIFNCQGHGWSNLQSMHINIAFANDSEFGTLHSAIRWILPFIPALSASSPIVGGYLNEYQSNRLSFYLGNQKKLQSIVGLAVPDVMKSQQEYQQKILQPMYDEIAPYDPKGILQFEWLNSRGAIPKFEVGCIEIRLADVQESPIVDLSIANFWIKVLKKIASGTWLDLEQMDNIPTVELRRVLDSTVHWGENAMIANPEILTVFGLNKPLKAQELIQHLQVQMDYEERESQFAKIIQKIGQQGTLSTRLRRSICTPTTESILSTYSQLCQCLATGSFFEN